MIKPIPNEDNYIRKQWGLSKEFVVGYSGNLGNAHDISTSLLAAELLKDHEEICFLFIGGGVGMAELKKQFEKRDIRNVVFKPYQSRDLLDLSLSVADIHWMTLEPQMEGFIVPSKFYGILAVGRPIIFIGDTSGDIAKEIERVGCGVSIEVGNVKALVEKINNFYVNDEIVYSMGQCGRKEFESMYDMPISLDKFKVMFKKMSETSV